MDGFSKEVDKLLQDKRREQDDCKPARQRQGAPDTDSSSGHYLGRRGGGQIPEHSSFRGRGWRGSRGHAPPRPSYSKRARGSEFSAGGPAAAAAPAVVWTGGAKSFDYGHASLNPVNRATPSTSRSSSGTQSGQGRSLNPLEKSAASKLAEVAAAAQLLKVRICCLDTLNVL